MALSKDLYKAFEDVVGSEYICDEPAIMPAYHFTDLAAVVLPKNTDEVQALVKLCNKHKLQFRAVSTGWSWRPFPAGIVYLDLRRMNRIIEINEKNMYAVVEPYVISAQLQAELMKRGLNFNIKGAGSNCSAIQRGHGHMDQTTGGDDRNQLAMEWVTPEGDIVRLGSLGSSNEWFCGDGPGPSLRGVVSGTMGGPGIYTKTAMKVYPWPGPTKFPIEGISPNLTLSEIPPNMMVRYYSFPSIEKQFEAELKIGESEISFEVMCFNTAMVASNITTSNEEEEEMFERLNKDVQGPGFMVIIIGDTPEDFEYKKRVLLQIISETEGKSLKLVEDPKIGGTLLCQCIRITASIRETFRAGGIFSSTPVMGQRDLGIKWLMEAGERKGALIDKGLIVSDGIIPFGWGVEHMHLGKTEIFCRSTREPEPVEAVTEWMKENSMKALDGCFAVPFRVSPDIAGPRISNYHLWLQKFTQAFDPNGTAPD